LIFVLTSDVVDVFLVLLQAENVFLEGNLVLSRGGSVETDEVSDLLAVGRIFMDSQLQFLAELFVKLLEVLLVLNQLLEKFHAFVEVLANDL
jgi:hypothetical protein